MSSIFPKQPVSIMFVDPNWGKEEIFNQLKKFSSRSLLSFGGDLYFQMTSGTDYYTHMNEPHSFFEIKCYTTHDIEDLCQGSNVDLLKKQVWQQMKDISRKL